MTEGKQMWMPEDWSESENVQKDCVTTALTSYPQTPVAKLKFGHAACQLETRPKLEGFIQFTWRFARLQADIGFSQEMNINKTYVRQVTTSLVCSSDAGKAAKSLTAFMFNPDYVVMRSAALTLERNESKKWVNMCVYMRAWVRVCVCV